VRIVPEGIQTESSRKAFDVIIFATGFDAVTGSILRINPQGRDGKKLSVKWSNGASAYLGLMTHSYPNLFFVNGPGSPSVVGNCITNIEQHVEWISDCLVELRSRGKKIIEAEEAAENQWVRHVGELADKTLMPLSNSWWIGANIPGKPRVFLAYLGGAGKYRKICSEVAADKYAGFRTE
jgi:cyclohexanone monooxygenase